MGGAEARLRRERRNLNEEGRMILKPNDCLQTPPWVYEPLGVKVEVFDLPPGEALVTAKDQRACDRWLASRVARFYGACAPARALELLLDDRVKIGASDAVTEEGLARKRARRARMKALVKRVGR